jgi:hypothetical protein
VLNDGWCHTLQHLGVRAMTTSKQIRLLAPQLTKTADGSISISCTPTGSDRFVCCRPAVQIVCIGICETEWRKSGIMVKPILGYEKSSWSYEC